MDILMLKGAISYAMLCVCYKMAHGNVVAALRRSSPQSPIEMSNTIPVLASQGDPLPIVSVGYRGMIRVCLLVPVNMIMWPFFLSRIVGNTDLMMLTFAKKFVSKVS